MTFGKFLDPKNDLAFKRIFGTERNKDILIHFLNDIFTRSTNPIENVTFLKSTQDPHTAAQRVSIVDILCEDSQGNRFIIEMQVANEPSFVKRAQYYAAKAYIEQRDKGVAYLDLQGVTFLAITNFILFPQKENYLSHHHILDQETYEQDLKDFSFSFLELPKFMKDKDHLRTMTEKWAYFFKHAIHTQEEDLLHIIGDDLIIKRAYEELNRFAWSVEELRFYDSVDMKQEADKSILEGAFLKGREEGMTTTASAIALKLLKKGMSVEEVVEDTGLPLSVVADLHRSIL